MQTKQARFPSASVGAYALQDRACAGAGGVLSAPVAWAREGVEVGGNSMFTNLVSADQVGATPLCSTPACWKKGPRPQCPGRCRPPQVRRLRAIAQRIIPYTVAWNPRARDWRWEVNLIGSNQINAFCMPGSKIAFYTGLLQTLQLSDDEVAMVAGP